MLKSYIKSCPSVTDPLFLGYMCKCPAEQRLHWGCKEKRILGQSITSSIVKSLSEASFGLILIMG